MAFPIVNTPLLQNINGVTRQINLETSAAQVKTADGSDVESKLAALSGSLAGRSTTFVTGDIAGRDALSGMKIGDQVWVKDASADPTVARGAAKYIYESEAAGWVKTAEAESMDLVIAWDDVQGKPDVAAADIDQAVANAHEHANRTDVLDKLGADPDTGLTFDGKAVGGRYGAYVTVQPEEEGFEAAVAALNLPDGAFFTVVAGA